MKIPIIIAFLSIISVAYAENNIELINNTAISEHKIECSIGEECMINHGQIDIYLFNEDIVRQLLMEVVQATLNANSWKQHWKILTYAVFILIFFTIMGICLCKLQRNIRKKMIYFFRFIHYRNTYQSTTSKLKVFSLLALFAATIVLSYFALKQSQSIQPALSSTLSAFEQGYYAQGNQSILVGQGQSTTQFHSALMNYQFSLNRIKTKCNHLIGYRHLEDLEMAVESASKILPNNTMLDILQYETDKIGLQIATIQEQTRIMVQFINFVRDQIIGNRLKFIKVKKFISQFLEVNQLPQLLSSWVKSLIMGILVLSSLLFLIFLKVCCTGLLIFTKHINKINFIYSFLITTTFFMFFIHFSLTHTAFTGCILKQDFKNATLFEEYFANYNSEFGSRMDAQYLRKIEGHTNGDLSSVMQTDVFNATNQAIDSIAVFKKIVTSQQMESTNHQLMQIATGQGIVFVDEGSNETYLRQNISVLLQKMEEINTDLSFISNYRNASLFNYDMSQIGRYLSAITVQICRQDFSILLYFSKYYFCIVALALLQYKVLLSLIKLKKSKQENMIELAALSRTDI